MALPYDMSPLATRYKRENPANKPNPLVFTLLCQALGVEMPDEQLDLRIETNYYAFRNAIRSGRQ